MPRTNPLPALMRREWMQHRTAWLLVMLAPSALMLIVALLGLTVFQASVTGATDSSGAPFVGMDLGPDGPKVPLSEAPPVLHTMMWTAAMPAVTALLAALVLAFQLPGVAYRDQQDRSIEFWRSLPVADWQAVGATVLMHLLVLPLLAVLAAFVAAQAIALVTVGTTQGLLAWLTQPWWMLLPAMLALLARLLLAVVLGVLWLSPLLLIAMCAGAWLRRWGLPMLAVLLIAGPQLLDRVLPRAIVGPALNWVLEPLGTVMFSVPFMPGTQIAKAEDLAPLVLPEVPGWAWRDALASLGQVATPHLLGVLLVSGLAFWLLVRRHRAD